MASFTDRIKSAWNAFTPPDSSNPESAAMPLRDFKDFMNYTGSIYSTQPHRTRLRINSERTIISSIYARMSIDAAAIAIRHTRHDDSDRYLQDIDSGLNECLRVEANLDQAARAFRQDIFLTLFDKGVAAIVPVDTTIDPTVSGSFDVKTLRVGEVIKWYPQHVKVSVYNERTGSRQEVVLAKKFVAIVENPLYSVMNETNSTLQRLIQKLSYLDATDEATSSGKLDLIIQLPYVIKSDARRQQADQRAKDIEMQLRSGPYGIAYTDGTEKITQLNRPVENRLLEQITTLRDQLYSELGLTPEVMNGTADEAAMLHYNNRTIEPLVSAVAEEMKRTFLTKTARTQGQSIDYFRDPFKLVPMADLAELADKLTRNEIVTSNEFRAFIGMKPSSDPKADQLVNSNMPQAVTGVPSADTTQPAVPGDTPSNAPDGSDLVASAAQSGFDSINSTLDDVFKTLGVTDG